MGKDMNGLFSSATDEWATPQDLFDRLNEEFGFDLDVCANAKNSKCAEFFTKEQDGLSQSWAGHRVWCNPPYGREVLKWVKKAHEETKEGGGGNDMRDAGGNKDGYEVVAGLRYGCIRGAADKREAALRRCRLRSSVPVCDSGIRNTEASEILNL